jgi:hypothetical protein
LEDDLGLAEERDSPLARPNPQQFQLVKFQRDLPKMLYELAIYQVRGGKSTCETQNHDVVGGTVSSLYMFYFFQRSYLP